MAERWITWRGKHILVDDDGNIVKKRKYLAEEYTSENINEYFNNIETTDELIEWQEDYFKKVRFYPIIVPIKNSINRRVDNIKKIDSNNISFMVLDYETGGYRATKSSINNFKKNYKARME